MQMERKKVGIWIRVSTEFQVKDESPEHHEQRAQYYIKSKDWEAVEVYRLDAISGKTVMDHPETQRMLRDVRTGRISGLVFSKLARLARNTKELLELADIFKTQKADLISLAEQIDTSTPAGTLFFTIISAMAQWEREEISARVSASVPIRAEMGKCTGGAGAFGYKWDNKQFVLDENEAPVRKLMYEIFLECRRKRTTANRLNELGHRTRKGAKFTDTTVDRLLRDTTAKGIRLANYTKSTGENKSWELKPEDQWVEVPCPAIVDEEVWESCNAILEKQRNSRNKNGRFSYSLLGGIVKCSCGKPMYVHGSRSRKYKCSSCKNDINQEALYGFFQENLNQYIEGIKPEIFIAELSTEIHNKADLLNTTMKNRDALLKRMDELVDLKLNDGMSSEHYKARYYPLDEQVKQLNRSIPELQAEIDYMRIQMNSSDYVLNGVKSLYTDWSELEFSQKRGITETITQHIIVGKDTIDIALAYLPTTLKTSQHNLMDLLTQETQKKMSFNIVVRLNREPVVLKSLIINAIPRLENGSNSICNDYASEKLCGV